MFPFNLEAAARINSVGRRVERLETLEGGGGGDFVLIEKKIVTALLTTEIIFNNIPTDHKHLFIIFSVAGPTNFVDP